MTNTVTAVETTEGKIYGYARVSTVQQDLEVQMQALGNYGVSRENGNLYSEKFSGKSLNNRKMITTLLENVKAGDTIVVYKLDRLGRSIMDVVKTYEDLQERGVYLVSISEGIDTRRNSDMMTKAMITMLGLFAEMERNFIIERTTNGRELAMERGVQFGRPMRKDAKVEHAIDLYREGKMSITKIADVTGVGRATICRRVKALKEAGEL